MAERVGIEIPMDGGEFQRLCAKMATGSGKTVVMAMVIGLAGAEQDRVPARHTLLARRAGDCTGTDGEAEAGCAWNRPIRRTTTESSMSCPRPLQDKLRRGRVAVRNWHALNWETDEQIKRKRSVDKRGRQERRRLREGGAGRHGKRPQPAGDQRRSAPCLAHASRRTNARREKGRTGIRRPSGSAAWTASRGRVGF